MISDNQNDNLIPTTLASNGSAMQAGEENKQTKSRRLKSSAALAASALLSTSLLLSACGDDDCIPTTPPSNTNTSFVLPAPPSSTQFTTGTANPTNQTYCRSRRTGTYFWFVGSTGSYNSGGVGASS